VAIILYVISLLFSSKIYNVLKTSISWGVRRLNLSLISFFILSNDSNTLLTCLKSKFCVCWCVGVLVGVCVGTPLFPVEIGIFSLYRGCMD